MAKSFVAVVVRIKCGILVTVADGLERATSATSIKSMHGREEFYKMGGLMIPSPNLLGKCKMKSAGLMQALTALSRR